MSRSILPVLLTLSLVLAGCNGFVFGSDEAPAQTLTPVDVPTDKSTPTPTPQLPPGLTEKGVTDPLRLAESHRSILDNTSYSIHTNSTTKYTNGTVYSQITTRTQYAANDSQFYRVLNQTGGAVRGSSVLLMWSTGKRLLMAQTRNNSTSYSVSQSRDGEPIPAQDVSFTVNRGRIASLFGSVDTHVVSRMTRNETTLYRVVGTNMANPTVFVNKWHDPRNVTLQALINSEGVVKKYQLNYTATLNGTPVQIYRQVNYTDLGDTTIERPPWYEAAIRNTSTTTPTAMNTQH